MFFAGQTVTTWSQLGFVTNASVKNEKVAIKYKTQRSNKETFKWTLGEDDIITDNYNEIRLSCHSSIDCNVIARDYDGSVAFRYELPSANQASNIKKELTEFNFT